MSHRKGPDKKSRLLSLAELHAHVAQSHRCSWWFTNQSHRFCLTEQQVYHGYDSQRSLALCVEALAPSDHRVVVARKSPRHLGHSLSCGRRLGTHNCDVFFICHVLWIFGLFQHTFETWRRKKKRTMIFKKCFWRYSASPVDPCDPVFLVGKTLSDGPAEHCVKRTAKCRKAVSARALAHGGLCQRKSSGGPLCRGCDTTGQGRSK